MIQTKATSVKQPELPVDWSVLKAEVYGAFSPGSPIKLTEDLAGREVQAQRLRSVVLSAGEHALIYGERGVGKTSIANTFYLSLNGPNCTVSAISINCGEQTFTKFGEKCLGASEYLRG